jgi:WD40 repeat protein
LTVSYTAADSGYTFCKLEFQTDKCPAVYYLSAGYFGLPPTQKTLEITKPVAGDIFVVGTDTIITWRGIAEIDTVRLEYSIDNGATWKLIEAKATGLKYYWKNVPQPASQNCKIRAKQVDIGITQSDSTGLQYTLSGHTYTVNNICWSPDGSRVATASDDNTGIIWDAMTGHKLHTLTGHTKDVNHISWSPDGSRVATASDDSTGIIWDAVTGHKLHTLSGHTNMVYYISWSPDASKVATASEDWTGIIWDVATGNKLQTLAGHYYYVHHICWSPDGSRVATSGGDKIGIIWDAVTGSKIHNLTGHTQLVSHISWSPDGSRVATASRDKTGIIWDAAAGSKIHTLSGHTNYLNHISWSPDGSRVATASSDKTGIIWDAVTGKKLHTLLGHNSVVMNISWSPDGSKVATASNYKSGIIWDAGTGNQLHTLLGHNSVVYNISWSPDGSRVATASADNTGIIWDVATGNKLHTLAGHTNSVFHISWSPDSRKVATAGLDKTGIIWDAVTSNKLFTLEGHTREVYYISWSPDGSRVATASYDSTAIIWDAATGNKLHTLAGHTSYVNHISWNPDGIRVATASNDRTAIIWNSLTGNKLHTLTGHTNNVHHISWSPDGSRVATASWDNTGIIWDATTGSNLHTLLGHTREVVHISWSPDDSRVATASWDNTGIIWDATTGNKLHTLSEHYYHVNLIYWSPDGSRVATASEDKTSIIWDVVTGNKIHTLSGNYYHVNHICWSPDGSRVATASGDSTGIIWDAMTGNKIRTLTGHTNQVNHISWSPDGSRVATASNDRSAKIWVIENPIFIIQEDESEIFSIVAPQATSNDIDMGKVVVNNRKDSVITNFISNSGTWKFRVDSIYFRGADASAFSLLGGHPIYEIEPSKNHFAEFRFAPMQARKYNAEIVIITQSDTLIQNITGEGIAEQVQINNKIINFGKVYLGYQKDTVVTAVIKNISSSQLNITKVEHYGPDRIQFSILEGNEPFSLNAGDTKEMRLRFFAKELGRASGSIAFHYNGVGSPAVVQLFAEAYNIVPSVKTNSPMCIGHDLMLYADSIPHATYHWSGPKGFQSNLQNIIIKKADYSCSGLYKLYVTLDTITTDTIVTNVEISTDLVSPGDSSFIFVGHAERIDDYIKLTNPKVWSGGSIWLKNRFSIKHDFSTTFQFRVRYGDNNIGDKEKSVPGADGIAFVMQNHIYPALGEKGGSMGYTGIPNSLAIEFDLYENEYDPNGNHIAVQSLGALPNIPEHDSGATLGINSDIPEIKSDSLYYVKIEYSWTEKILKIYLSSNSIYSVPVLTINDIDLASYLNLIDDEYVFLGITSATGRAFQQHDILNWVVPCNNLYVDVNDEINYSADKNLHVYPNPLSDKTLINFYLQSNSKVEIVITDLLGIEVAKLVNHELLDSGSHSIEYDASNLKSGIYFCTLNNGCFTETVKFVVVK